MDCMRNGFEKGKLLDERFLTVSPLNHGSFGMVFAAKDTLTGADVAVKCITKPNAVKDQTICPAAIAVDDRSEELEIHSRLSTHPNIVNLVCNFESDNHQYMVLELCSNGDLYEAIRVGRGPLETEHVRALMLELVDAIEHLHVNGVYHRDIKPENIFLTAQGSLKLGDFGLATTDTWSTEFAVGSDRYMAPEQFDASIYGYGYSPASADVWAIGIVLLNVLFQRNPFATPTQKDPLFADFVHDRQSLFDVFPNLSQDTYDVLVHSLALDPANRSLSAVRKALTAVVSFTTEDESLDEFCTELTELVPVATAAREPLRTPSVTSPPANVDSFPWASALLKTPQKTTRQLSTIHDEEIEMFPGSVKSEWQYVDTDEVSLSSNVDSGLGMSYKSTKSANSSALKKAKTSFVGSLPISFSRPFSKTSPYGAKGSGFSKSWSDLWDEDEEMEQNELRSSFEAGMDIERVSTAKPSTPQLTAIREEDRGSLTPRQFPAQLNSDTRTASPLHRLIEDDKANPEPPKQRSNSIMDRWAALGNLRRAKPDNATVITTAAPQKTKYAEAFANFSPFSSSSKKQKSESMSSERRPSWRQGSPARLRTLSNNNSRTWERKDKDQSPPGNSTSQGAWSLDNNWREHKPPAQERTPSPKASPQRKKEPTFLDMEFDDDGGDVEWIGGWHDFQV